MVLAIAVPAVAGLGACGEPPATPLADPALMNMNAAGVAYGVEMVVTAHGVQTGLIKADTVYTYHTDTDSAYTELTGVQATFHFDDGRVRARLISDHGTTYDRTEEFVARGNVDVRLASGEQVLTELLRYDPASDEIRSDSATTIVHVDGRETRGSCFISDLDFENYEICQIRGAPGVPAETARSDTTGAGGGV